jgi:hypothetical protein
MISSIDSPSRSSGRTAWLSTELNQFLAHGRKLRVTTLIVAESMSNAHAISHDRGKETRDSGRTKIAQRATFYAPLRSEMSRIYPVAGKCSSWPTLDEITL